MRTLWRYLAAPAVLLGATLALTTPAQAANSEACSRAKIVSGYSGSYRGMVAPLPVIGVADALCAKGDEAIYRAVANTPLRDLGNTYSGRSNYPCNSMPSNDLEIQVQCVADWVEYIKFFGTRRESCLQDFDHRTSIKCYPQSAVYGLRIGLGVLALAGVIGLIAAVASRSSSGSSGTGGSTYEPYRSPPPQPYQPTPLEKYEENRRASSDYWKHHS